MCGLLTAATCCPVIQAFWFHPIAAAGSLLCSQPVSFNLPDWSIPWPPLLLPRRLLLPLCLTTSWLLLFDFRDPSTASDASFPLPASVHWMVPVLTLDCSSLASSTMATWLPADLPLALHFKCREGGVFAKHCTRGTLLVQLLLILVGFWIGIPASASGLVAFSEFPDSVSGFTD